MYLIIKCLKQTIKQFSYTSSKIFGHPVKLQSYLQNRINFVRHYSQPIIKIDNLVPIKKTKRHPRRKSFIEGQTAEKCEFWNVVAVATAEHYDLDSIYKSLIKNKDYQPSKLFEQIHKADMEFEFLHAVSKHQIDKESRELFIFDKGSLVAWNVSDSELHNILNFVKNFEKNSYDDVIVNNELEVMPYKYSLNSKKSLFQNGNICLTQKENESALDKYTFSNGMVLSVKLGIWESLLDKYIESMENITMDLKLGKPIKMSRKQILRKTGELYALKHSINLSSDLLDVPDFYWDREELEELYLHTCRYFNIFRRTKVINDKLNDCIELVDLLSSHLSDRHHIRLEWMIIALITVEVMFEVIHYSQYFAS